MTIITYSRAKACDLYQQMNNMHLPGYFASLLIGMSLGLIGGGGSMLAYYP